jgi:8-oxo-dGTP diphosphatase
MTEPVVRLFHGTTQAALDSIMRSGQLVGSDSRVVVTSIEDRYGLPRDAVWDHDYFGFSRDRSNRGDQHIYFTSERSGAESYARAGSEVVQDALGAAYRIMNPEGIEDGPTWTEAKKEWVAAETAKYHKPIMLSLAVPWSAFAEANDHWRHAPEQEGRGTYEWWFGLTGGEAGNVSLPAPVPAAWITTTERLSRRVRSADEKDLWFQCADGVERWGPLGAAGVLFRYEDRYYLIKRGAQTDHGGTWGIPGGAIDDGEDAREAAQREATEEVGYDGNWNEIGRYEARPAADWLYTTFVVAADEEFSAGSFNWEMDDEGWFTPDEMAQLSLHPGLREALPRLTAFASKLASDGQLPPGWRWGENEDGEPLLIQPPVHHGPVMTEAQAQAQAWFGPVYHGTSAEYGRNIRQRGFRSPTLEDWELADWGTIEEVLKGDTIVIWFTEDRDAATAYAEQGGGDVVIAYLRPGHYREARGAFTGEPALIVDDVSNAAAISDARLAGAEPTDVQIGLAACPEFAGAEACAPGTVVSWADGQQSQRTR